MPRNLPLGNGSLLAAFDNNYQIRDLYWPHVGQENHALGHPFRLGVWANGLFHWLDDSRWERSLRYKPDTLVTDVALKHPDLNIEIKATDAVDFHENLLVRRFDITNLSEQERLVFFKRNTRMVRYSNIIIIPVKCSRSPNYPRTSFQRTFSSSTRRAVSCSACNTRRSITMGLTTGA